MAFTYAQLKQAIQDFTENSETTFVNNLPVFIRMAEEKILQNVQLSLFRKTATTSITTNSPYVNMPSDFLAPFSFSYSLADNTVTFMDFKDPSFIREYQYDTDTTGLPRYYATFDNTNFIVAPTPNDNYVVQLSYFYRPASLTVGGEDDTTWLSTNAETTLLYASLVEAYIFMKGERDTMQMYQQRMMEGLMQLKSLGETKQTTDLYRVGEIRRPQE